MFNNIKRDFSMLKTKIETEKKTFETSNTFCPDTFIKNEKVLEIIRKNLTPKEEEKNLFGEVFTPLELVCEMLEHLPAEVWTDKTRKWLDPANGIGNFPIVVYYKLMTTLTSIRDEKERSKWIIEEMLFMNELNPVNVSVCRKLFKMIDSNARPNIRQSDFLTNFDETGFDIILGNPPFQKHVEKNHTNVRLWDKFVIKCLDILKPSGLLGFITPPSWRSPDDKLYKVMTQNNQLLYLHIFDVKKAFQSISQQVDLYIIENLPVYKTTLIVDSQNISNKIDTREWAFLPNCKYEKIHKFMTREKNGIQVIFSHSIYDARKLNKIKSNEFKYPVVCSITKNGFGKSKNGEGMRYTNDNTRGHFGEPKILLSFNSVQYDYPQQVDFEGKYGMSQMTFGLPITSQKEGEEMLRAINTPEFKEIINATKWDTLQQTDWRMFKYFRRDFYRSFLKNKTSSKKTKKQLELMSKAITKKKLGMGKKKKTKKRRGLVFK